jgi:cyclopropane fatty-acyl-phospholipid synthase-like methyltransferase
MNFDELYEKHPGLYGNKPSAWIIKIFKYLDKPGRVLDLGICYGRNAIYLARKGCRVVGVDVSEVAIQQCLDKAKKNKLQIRCHHQDIKDFVFEGKFGAMLSTMTLQYLGKEKIINEVIGKMKAHTRIGGLNIISVPTDTKIGMEMPFYFDTDKLAGYYSDWEVLEFKELEDNFSNGKTGTIAFIIARKKRQKNK